MKTAIASPAGSPPAAGPYSSGIIASGRFLFVAGQGPWDPARAAYVRGTIEEQVDLTLQTIARLAAAGGTDMQHAVSVRVYLQQLTERNFAAMNSVYGRYFGPVFPVRTTIGAQLLNIDVEIDAVFALPDQP